MYKKKSLGQNFLIDKNIINKITNIIKIKDRDVIEIGPGDGSLTNAIIESKPKSLILIEKDFTLSKKLKFNIENILKKNSIIFGNLPYNISSQILVKFVKLKKWPPKYKDIVFMFQKELGEKIISKFSSIDYGRLSILTNYRLNAFKKFYVSANCFSPKPKVTSMVIHFTPKIKKQIKIRDISNLENVTKIMFSNKRKMINKNLLKIIDFNKTSEISGLKMNCRPSEIKPDIYYKITELYERN